MDSAAHDRPEQVRRDPRLPDGGHDAPEPHLPDPLPTGKYYIVEEGDWLSKIAEKFYADPMTYPILFDANHDPETAEERHTDVIADPDEIDVGWRLFIPDLPAAPAEPPGDPSGQKPTY
jgi:nucleoid-associated protein YgaU